MTAAEIDALESEWDAERVATDGIGPGVTHRERTVIRILRAKPHYTLEMARAEEYRAFDFAWSEAVRYGDHDDRVYHRKYRDFVLSILQ